MQGRRQFGAECEALEKRCNALCLGAGVGALTIEQRRDGRQSLSFETIEFLRDVESLEQRLAPRGAVLRFELGRLTLNHSSSFAPRRTIDSSNSMSSLQLIYGSALFQNMQIAKDIESNPILNIIGLGLQPFVQRHR